MEEANARAAKAILEPQNSGETGVLDLHGLYVKEAEVAAKTFLQRQRKAGRFREVEIITGTGHHSSDHQAKIKVGLNKLKCGSCSFASPDMFFFVFFFESKRNGKPWARPVLLRR